MRRLVPLISVIGASICFMAGYTVGKKHRYENVSTPPKTETSIPIEAPAPSIAAPDEILTPVKTMEAPQVIPAPTPDRLPFAQRAQLKITTLEDTKGRVIEVEILEVEQDSIKIRRQSDLKLLDVPIGMLCPEDQAFAAYLKQAVKPTPKYKTEADKIWNEMFSGY